MAKILIVEDSPDNMTLFRALLAARGHQGTGLTGGERLLEALDGAAPELALTAHAMPGDRERALEAGFDGYITKPIDIRRFPPEVERALGSGTHPS